MKRIAPFVLLLLLLQLTVPTFAQTIPQIMTFQGHLTHPDGTPVADNDAQPLTFRLFSTAIGGTPLWSQNSTVAVHNGTFCTLLNFSTGYQDANTLPSVFSNPLFTPYLEIQVGSDTPLAPRQPSTSVAYAFCAGMALSVPDGSIGLSKLAPGVLSFGNLSGTISPGQIAAGSITGDKLASGTIPGDKLASGSITGDKIASGTLTLGNLTSSLQQTLGLFTTAPGTTPGVPILLSTTATDSNPHFVAVSGGYAYVVNSDSNTLQAYNVSNPASPMLTSTTATGDAPFSIAVSGGYAYVTNSDSNRLQVFDVSNPASPMLTSTTATGSYPYFVAVSGGYAYVVNTASNTLQVFDVSNPASPILKSTTATGTRPRSVAVSGSYAYVVNSISNTLQVFDVSNPASPILKSTKATDNAPFSIAVSGGYAYVVNSSSKTLQVFAVSNPASPILTSTTAPGTGPLSIAVSGGYAYVINSNGTLQAYNVSNPASPILTSTTATDSDPYFVAVSGGYAYVISRFSDTLQIFGLLSLTPCLTANVQFSDGTIQTTSFQGAAAGGDLTGTYPNPSIASNAVTNTKLASDAASLNKVSAGAMTVASGNIGIGTSSPANPLVVAGTGGAGTNLSRGVHLGIDTLSNSHIEVVGGSPYIDFNTATTGDYQARLILQDSGTRLNLIAANVRVTGTFENLSDARFKQNVAPVTNALESILNLRGVAFDWKPNVLPDMKAVGRQLGFLAQEVEAVLPLLVSTDEKGVKAVNYQGVIPVLVEAVKTLKKDNDALHQDNDALHQDNGDKQRQIDALKARLDAIEHILIQLKPTAK